VKKPSFLQGAAVGALIAVAGASLFATLRLFMTPAAVLEMLIPLTAGAYLAYLLTRSGVRTGRFATFASWIVSAAAIALFVHSLALALVLHALLVWLARSLYFHEGALAALADLGLSVLAVAAAVGTAQHSHSPFLALWTFFLIQALFVAIPESLAARDPNAVRDEGAPFRRARHAADGALRRLLSPR
jgi:hypothetical protein